jgi:biotin-dependent carboxylase-like uncharacterized protein
MATISLRRPGLLTTVQDLGRPGHGRFGVSPSGAMDPVALRVANRLVGNHEGAPALEITAVGPEVEFLGDATFALAGANLSPSLNGVPLEVWRSYPAGRGDVLSFGARRQGARCYLALDGGLECPAVFGSTATDLESGIGGIDGGPLRAGQCLSAGTARGPSRAAALPAILRAYASPFELRFLPEASSPPDEKVVRAFAAAAYRIAPRSNRMGYRLDGPALGRGGGGMLSEPVPPGAIQLPPDGQPILLMADRPTVGGYPRLGAVIAADAPKAGQLWLGHEVRFRPVHLDEARAALAQLEEWLERAVPR